MSHDALLVDLARLSKDPLAWVLWAFPWKEPGSELEFEDGPEEWQRKVLCDVRDGLPLPQAIQEAVASGHGVGKSALVSWLILWAISTFEDTRGVVTANTETQLKTKTWAELGKWYRLSLVKDLFHFTATALFSRDPEHEKTWRIDMVPWSERNTEAFAGLHNKGRRILVVFDEASAIPNMIWETTEGALTDADTQIIWVVFGNPTRNVGRFKEAFAPGSRWRTYEVDSRTVRFTNKAQIARWIEDYGEDSDFVRVRVRGMFPRAGTAQFIPDDLIAGAAFREPEAGLFDPLVLGVDVARFGGDDTVIYIRKGRDGRTYPPIKLQPADSTVPWSHIVANRVAELASYYRADAVFVDAGGVGAGVVDALRALRVQHFAIQFGSKPDRAPAEVGELPLYANKRAEMWGFMKDWLRAGAIPDDPALREQLAAPEYGYNNNGAIQLEKKEDMRGRGLPSPDIADALALTFAYAVMPNELAGWEGAPANQHVSDYDPFSEKALAA